MAGLFFSGTCGLLIFPFLTYVPSDGMLGELLPKVGQGPGQGLQVLQAARRHHLRVCGPSDSDPSVALSELRRGASRLPVHHSVIRDCSNAPPAAVTEQLTKQTVLTAHGAGRPQVYLCMRRRCSLCGWARTWWVVPSRALRAPQ